MTLTVNQIRRLLEELEYETIYSDNTTLRLQRRMPGYSSDGETGALQAGLSIMLEVASRREAGV